MGREEPQENNMFFVCAVIEAIGRKTKNKRIDIAEKIGARELERIFSLADVYHCEPIEKTADDLIERFNIADGDFDNIKKCKYTIPDVFSIAKVYKRLMVFVMKRENISPINALFSVYSSPVAAKIDDYNASMYYENPQYLELFYVRKTNPEFLEKFANELSTAILNLPDYIKRECGGSVTPIKFLKLMLRDTAISLNAVSRQIAAQIADGIAQLHALDVPFEEIAAEAEVDVTDIKAFFEKHYAAP
jgi:hypothetical protein